MKRNFVIVVLLLINLSSFAQSLEQGIKHLELEQYERAKRIFASLSKSDAKNAAEYNYYLGEVYLRTDKPDSARYFFSEGIKANDNFALNYAGMGKLSMESNATEGKRSFDRAIELSKSKDSRVLSSIAEYYITSPKKDIPQAISLLERAMKADPKNPYLPLLLGDAYLEQNDGAKAKVNYDQSFKLNDKLPNYYLKTGKIYVKARNYTLGLENFNKGIALDPNFAPLYRETGELYYKAKQYNKAIENYKKYVDMTDKSFDTDFRYGSFLYFNKDYKGAIEIMSRLAKQDNSNPYLNRLLAYSYYETGSYSKGLENMETFWKKADEKKHIAMDYEYYGRLLSKISKDSVSLVNKAINPAMKDSLALINFNKAIAKDTSNSDLYSEIGFLYLTKKDYKRATSFYLQRIAKGSPAPQDYLNLGKAYYFDKQ
ncbi:MAG TPA: tetratricopeptide repeat protein, partial [Cytophagaceae bacterium]